MDKNQKMINCKKCGYEMPDNASFCPKCGYRTKHKKIVTAMIIAFAAIAVIGLGVGGYIGYKHFMDNRDIRNSARQRNQQEVSSRYQRYEFDFDFDSDDEEYVSAPETDKIELDHNATTTVLAYFIGSNLETEGGNASSDIKEMQDAILDDDVNIVIQTGGAKDWQIPEISDGEVDRFCIEDGELVKLESLGKLNMVKEDTLVDFIQYGATNFPADNYILVLWDHGGGIPVGFGYDEIFPAGELKDVELGSALEKAGVHFDTIVFDACNMCTLEVALAIADSVDYMVAAESYVNGVGIYYTNWLTKMASGETEYVQDYCETMVADYMDSLDQRRLVGSMSVIKLSKVYDVYEEYVNYLAEAYKDICNGGYDDYLIARGNCGYYEGTDSVDLCTLCTQYNNKYSTSLFNAVVNAVVYTESDFDYGHGLTAYSPYENFKMYTWGRRSLETLGYDDAILDFYDAVVSAKVDLNVTADADDMDSDWYNSDHDIETGSLIASASQGEDLSVDDMGAYFALRLADDEWKTVENIAVSVYVDLEDDVLMWLGEDYFSEFDDDGNLMIIDPDAWTYINDAPCTYRCVDYYMDEAAGKWSQHGYVYVHVNGKEAFLVVYYDDEYPYGSIQGYYYADFDTDSVTDYTMYTFAPDDVVTLMYYAMDLSANEKYFIDIDKEYRFEDIELEFKSIDLTQDGTYLYYILNDIYGNSYETEMVNLQ